MSRAATGPTSTSSSVSPWGSFDNFSGTDPVVNGVSLRIAPATPSTTTFADAALGVGRTIVDPLTGVSITTVSVGPAGASVSIQFAPDSQSPTGPASLTASPSTSSSEQLSWPAATDNVGVVGYRVYRGGAQIAQVTSLSHFDAGLSANTTYTYAVRAVDAAGNLGAARPRARRPSPSTALSRPCRPGLTAAVQKGRRAILSWNASFDNVGVVAYDLYRNGSHVAGPTRTGHVHLSGARARCCGQRQWPLARLHGHDLVRPEYAESRVSLVRETEAVAYVRVLVLAALLGAPVAFAAVLFQTAIYDVIHVVWEVIPEEVGWSEPAWWYVILVPGLAGLIVAAALRLPGQGGHSPLGGLGAEPVAPIDLSSILPAALATLGLGLVLGPEAPLIALGLGLGALAVRLVSLEGTSAQLLAFAGAFASIAALFGGPLIAAFLLFEVTAASGKIPAQQIGRALLPGFVAAGTGALVFTGVADWDGLHQESLALPALPTYESVRLKDLAWGLVVAVVVAAVVVALRHVAHLIAAARLRPVGLLVVAGLAVGVLAVVFRATTDRPVDLVLFSGQAELPAVVAEGSAWVLVALIAAKGLAYALSLGAGFRGGPVFPAIAIGVAVAVAAADVLPGLHTTPAVAAGIAAGTTAVLRVPFTAVLLVALLMGSSAFDVAPIAVLAAALAWIVSTALPVPEDRRKPAATEAAPAASG